MKFLTAGFRREDLLRIAPGDLPLLAGEVRERIIETVRENGGHLGSSLGAVELTMALLRRFDPLHDRIVFDVGHQVYPYKLLTDRADRFDTLRLKDGICGFPRRSESPCDHFNTGHSSTSVSAALGYAKARDLLGQDHHVVAFTGDAALINGLAFEALNHVKETKTRLIIVLNDNKHSISPRVGGFATMLARLSASTSYNRIKAAIKECCRALPAGEALQRRLEGIHDQIKALVKPANIFDDLDINYWGPFDGHDIQACEMIFELAKGYDRPVLLHFNTVKGRGMPEAEENPTKYHQMSPRSESERPKARTWSEAASSVTEQLAKADPRIVCLTAAMATGVKLEHFRSEFPDRFFDVGIAESHMLTLAAGMAAGGMRPWVFIYSTFLQRAMDQLTHDIALQDLPVVLMVDRAGLVGSDGDTHQGLLDVSWSRAIPNLEVYAPSDEASLRQMMAHAASRSGPTLIRYPRGSLPIRNDLFSGREPLGAVQLRSGTGWALMGHGVAVHILLDVHERARASGLSEPAVFDIRRLKPLDAEFLDETLRRYPMVAVAEENYLDGGVGEAVAARIAEGGHPTLLRRFGVPDVCVPHATIPEQRELYGLTAENILSECRSVLPVRAHTA
ncbi:1-deoxy-D-xylulose-5-phosphate synthase [uncultured Fretibacterium sp.]|uniref:1-deoxy-D-xylulose-5-phosphate synthase n=1 Tax=uncultured Fretibacterium sp. TaxID=1678694 RepID=UPI00325FB9A9